MITFSLKWWNKCLPSHILIYIYNVYCTLHTMHVCTLFIQCTRKIIKYMMKTAKYDEKNYLLKE